MVSPLTLNNFAAPSLEILDHMISAAGVVPTADYAAEIELCPPPEDVKQVQRFLGMVNFYRRFLPNCAQVLRPLTDLVEGGDKTLEWTASTQEAFQDAKCHLAEAVPLQYPTPNAELSLAPFQRGRWAAYPLLGFHKKNCAISRQAFHSQFSASRCGWSHSGN